MTVGNGANRREHVIVVGGGFAGMSVARSLAAAGLQPLVLEARDRIGGRVWSGALDNGAVVERGAENLMPYFPTVLGLARELGLTLYSGRASYYSREVLGPNAPTVTQMADANARLDTHIQQLLAALTEPVSLGDAVRSAPLSPTEREVIEASLLVSLGEDLDQADLATLATYGDPDGPGNGVPFRVAGGNDQIAACIAKELGENAVHLNSAVVSIAQRDARVTVRCRSGQRFEGIAAIITTPVPLVRSLTFDPPLPAATTAAYNAMGFAGGSKISVEITSPRPPQFYQDYTKPFALYITANSDGSDPTSVTAVGGSGEHEQRLGIGDGRPDRWAAIIDDVLPDSTVVGRPLLTRWHAQEWSHGANSYRPLGWSPAQEQALVSPCGRIAFAGEHTAGEFQGSTEGALRSGQRAAAEIISLLTYSGGS